jgi:hypothetical protein
VPSAVLQPAWIVGAARFLAAVVRVQICWDTMLVTTADWAAELRQSPSLRQLPLALATRAQRDTRILRVGRFSNDKFERTETERHD